MPLCNVRQPGIATALERLPVFQSEPGLLVFGLVSSPSGPPPQRCCWAPQVLTPSQQRHWARFGGLPAGEAPVSAGAGDEVLSGNVPLPPICLPVPMVPTQIELPPASPVTVLPWPMVPSREMHPLRNKLGVINEPRKGLFPSFLPFTPPTPSCSSITCMSPLVDVSPCPYLCHQCWATPLPAPAENCRYCVSGPGEAPTSTRRGIKAACGGISAPRCIEEDCVSPHVPAGAGHRQGQTFPQL